jgi:nucleoside-diphosphate-sugar epimerase
MVPFLRSLGYDVKVMDNRIVKRPDYIRADICSTIEVMQAFKQWDIDYVLHLAGEVGRENGELFARRQVDVNVSGTLNIIQMCREFGSRLVFAGTSEAYGEVGSVRMTEDMESGKLTNCYAMSKYQAEQYIRHFVENYGLEAHIIRIFMCYGPGEYPSYFRSAVSRFVYNVLHDRPITVHKGAVRSWCYVDDICAGWHLVMEHFAPKKCELYNIGKDDPRSMTDVAQMVCHLAGKSVDLVRTSEPPRFVMPVKHASFEKARESLGFEAKTTLETGLRETIRWQKENVTDPAIEC